MIGKTTTLALVALLLLGGCDRIADFFGGPAAPTPERGADLASDLDGPSGGDADGQAKDDMLPADRCSTSSRQLAALGDARAAAMAIDPSGQIYLVGAAANTPFTVHQFNATTWSTIPGPSTVGSITALGAAVAGSRLYVAQGAGDTLDVQSAPLGDTRSWRQETQAPLGSAEIELALAATASNTYGIATTNVFVSRSIQGFAVPGSLCQAKTFPVLARSFPNIAASAQVVVATNLESPSAHRMWVSDGSCTAGSVPLVGAVLAGPAAVIVSGGEADLWRVNTGKLERLRGQASTLVSGAFAPWTASNLPHSDQLDPSMLALAHDDAGHVVLVYREGDDVRFNVEAQPGVWRFSSGRLLQPAPDGVRVQAAVFGTELHVLIVEATNGMPTATYRCAAL